MKNFILLSVFVVSFVIGYSQPKPQIIKPTKQDVARFINKTNLIIKRTKTVVDSGKVYTGALVKAVEFQKKAIADFKAGKVKAALNNSSVARDFCTYAYKKNTGNMPPKHWKPSKKFSSAINIHYNNERIEETLKKDDNSKGKEQGVTIDDLENVNANSKGKAQTGTDEK